MFDIQKSKYLDFLSKFGIGGAHPGGMALTKELLRAENISNTSQILDVGCGTGQTAAYLASTYKAFVTGIDFNSIMVAKAQNRMKKHHLPVNIIEASIEQIPLRDKQFDLIISESVLSFVNKSKALDEIYRLLKYGGRFIAIEFTMNQLLDKKSMDEIEQFYGFDTLLLKKDWVALFNDAGFQTIRIRKNQQSLSSSPEFQHSQNIERELYDVMNQHIEMNLKYDGILDYRIYCCTK
ncbi:class I SAM-dependent methyltransferase [Lysinibacillus sp. NPDC097279]|uniref:class I SAM-dependent methyltransferase n=1 Tax=Lysinibacillus sp. NPDC097279 TaxID=3364143 RepID=UPI00380DEEED